MGKDIEGTPPEEEAKEQKEEKTFVSPHIKDLSISVSVLNVLLQKNLPDEGDCKSLTSLTHQGFNNKVYAFQTATRSSEDLVIRICKLFWPAEKLESEVAALRFIKDNTSIPVPRVLCYDSQGVVFGFKWIIMERMPGDNLEDVWGEFDEGQQRAIIAQTVGFLKQLQDIEWDTIGIFHTSVPLGMAVSKEQMNVNGFYWPPGGPFHSTLDFTRYRLRDAIKELERKEILRPIRYFLPQAKRLLRLLTDVDEEELRDGVLPDVPVTTYHGDIALRNLRVDRETAEVTALLDWEWAGSMPAYLDWVNAPGGMANDPRFHVQAESQGLLTPSTIPGYREHTRLRDVCEHLSPWCIGLFGEEADKKIIKNSKHKLGKDFLILTSKFHIRNGKKSDDRRRSI